jgi:prepilin-type N-terminal cleavage/methylation domain-containing protein
VEKLITTLPLIMNKNLRLGTRMSAKGFTFVEVLIATALLLVIASGMSIWYVSGFRSVDAQEDSMLLTSRLRSRMEALAGTPFDQLTNRSEAVTVRGQSYTITWTAIPVDLNGDAITEPDAMLVTVAVSGMPNFTLSSIFVNHNGDLGKIP